MLNEKKEVSWSGLSGYYQVLYDIEMRLTDASEEMNIDKMILLFDELLIKTTPFIFNYLDGETEEEKMDTLNRLRSKDTVEKVKSKLLPGNTDWEDQQNQAKSFELLYSFNDKRMELSKYIAKSGLWLPMKNKEMNLPSGLMMDDR